MTRSEIRDTLKKRDMAAIKLGQASAKRYLRSKEQAQPTGFIREIIAGTAFVVLTTAVLVTSLAL